jgi:hypothetical protein
MGPIFKQNSNTNFHHYCSVRFDYDNLRFSLIFSVLVSFGLFSGLTKFVFLLKCILFSHVIGYLLEHGIFDTNTLFRSEEDTRPPDLSKYVFYSHRIRKSKEEHAFDCRWSWVNSFHLRSANTA